MASRRAVRRQTPTEEVYSTLQKAYDFFNEALFFGELPHCVITLQRDHKKFYGYYAHNRYGSREGDMITPEIALNPDHFHKRDAREIMGTLVHEMVHLQQFAFGKPAKKGHNKQWAEMMKEVGLYPSTTCQPGGKETGRNCSHYILEDGAFAAAHEALVEEGIELRLVDLWRPIKKVRRPSSTVSYVCPGCDAKVRGKKGLSVSCDDCAIGMLPQEKGDD